MVVKDGNNCSSLASAVPINEPSPVSFTANSTDATTCVPGTEGGITIAAVGGNGGCLLFWNRGEEKPFHRLALPNTARGMDLDQHGKYLATTHHDRKVRITELG